METLTNSRMKSRAKRGARYGASREPRAPQSAGALPNSLLLVLLAVTLVLSACGGGGTSGSPIVVATLSGNWQFTMSPQVGSDGQAAFLGGLQGGFILQSGSNATGAANYAVSLPELAYPCNTGSAPITGTLTGTVNDENEWTLTAVAGTQTFTLTGTESVDGSTIVGTYASTPGTAPDGSPCGIAVSGLQWSATLVPPITGSIQGNFHSTGGAAGLTNQDFPVSGSITQAQNTGANSATVTGSLSFLNSGTNVSDYPCLATASLYGQISGNSVNLQIVGTDQSILGQIGEPFGENNAAGIYPVTFDSAQGGYILHGVGPSYLVAATGCPGSLGDIASAGDYGNMCLAVASPLGSANACQQPVTLSPAALTFPAQILDTSSTLTITLANISTSTLNGLTLAFANNSGAENFVETDACGVGGAPSQTQPFSLNAGQSCVITITFTPQETCAVGAAQCPSPLTATLTVTSPRSADSDNVFSMPITGTAVTGNTSSARKIDFRQEDEDHHAHLD